MSSIRSSERCSECPHRQGGCVLSVLDEKALSEVSLHLRYVHLANRNMLFHAGAPIAGSYFVCQGKVKIYAPGPDGRSTLLRLYLPGELLVVPIRDEHTVTAQAVGEVRVGIVGGIRLRSILERHPRLALAVIQRQSDELAQWRRRVVTLATKPTRERLLFVLRELAARHGLKRADGTVVVDLDLSSKELADMVGATRQTVSCELGRLVGQGVILRERRQITIRDVKKLVYLDRRLKEESLGICDHGYDQ